MKAGDTFLYTDGSDNHLWVVISDPAQDALAYVITVNLTSSPVCQDESCVLQREDHKDFITRQTFVNYADARALPPAVVRSKLDQGVFVKRPAVSPEVLKKIRQGAAVSDHFPLGFLDIMNEQGLV
jgi:hypothetical protein